MSPRGFLVKNLCGCGAVSEGTSSAWRGCSPYHPRLFSEKHAYALRRGALALYLSTSCQPGSLLVGQTTDW